ncbi:Nucleolar protein 12 [Gnomoniopsis smithogilvyi]|uniref:Nucleolar protein 12 n=1 Tax=Gnomoniopsis smithogilvyi TaxID=1191159 RepID=A0A9W8YYG0_9PEZI|nr:Nucleolar protein 12 [Gnomoniopsis smithogilvyi]
MAKDKSNKLSASSKKIDPTLDALFSTSSGPVKAPEKSRYADLIQPKSTPKPETTVIQEEAGSEDENSDVGGEDDDDSVDDEDEGEDASEGEDDEELSELASSGDSEADERDAAAQLFAESQDYERKQKRKRKQDEFHDLESKYFEKLVDEEPPVSKKRKLPEDNAEEETEVPKAKEEDEDSSDGDIPVHESLAQPKKVDEVEKASRTVFLSNVSIEAVDSKKAKRKLLAHLSSICDKEASPPQSIESLRFRSIAFSTAAMPKRAAFITKATMDATTHSANAYAVYSSVALARTACAKLNGTIVLDRHLRVDSVAHPSEVDHRRCVFVGNLGFVDDETVLNLKIDEDGKEKTEKRKRTRVPMDVEEGLWRTFNQHAGKVESVRVVRDPVTRVGKGIAYVQFYDGNSVETALLLNEKKFPPMLPRTLRVSRCKAPHKTARAIEKKTAERAAALKASGKAKKGYVPKLTAEEQTMAGRAGKLLGHSAAAKARLSKSGRKEGKPRERAGRRFERPGNEKKGPPAGLKTPETIIFEGRRASARDAKPKDLKMKIKGKKKVGGGKPKKSSK